MVTGDVRKKLSIDSMYKQIKVFFNTFETSSRCQISTADCLMSGLAVFGLKYPSLLQFTESMQSEIRKQNLCRMFDIENIPCDTYMRERLDGILYQWLERQKTMVF